MTTQRKLLEIIFKLCLQKNITITAIESCTGGLISSAITDIPGSSKVFNKGLITYSNKSKVSLLGISESTISKYGAVSQEVITEMAVNPITKFKQKNQISIATSGVAGPGQSENKPVGLIWLASYKDNNLLIKELNLGNLNRNLIRQKTVLEALSLLAENLAT